MTFAPASATFQDTHQMLHLPRYFKVVSSLRVPDTAICRKSTFATSQNAAPATTSRKATSQKSAAPATKKRRTCIDTFPKYCACPAKRENDLPFVPWERQNEHFVRDFLHCSYFEGKDCVAVNGEKLMTQRRRHDDDTTKTTRTQVQPHGPQL